MFNKIITYLQPALKLFRNKYLVSISLFMIWVIFFDHNNLIDRAGLVGDVNQLESDRDYYIERIQLDSARLIELKSSPENLEKFAREQYLMKKENEDIFIIVNK